MIMIFVSVRKQENKLKKYQFTSTAARRGSTESSNGGDYEEAIRKKKREDDRRRHAQSRQVGKWLCVKWVNFGLYTDMTHTYALFQYVHSLAGITVCGCILFDVGICYRE